MSKTLDAVMEFGKRYDFGRGLGHALKVRDLALKLFEATKKLGLHNMDDRARFWLEAAALIHDIGVKQNDAEHHKVSKSLILSSKEPKRRAIPTNPKAVA